MKRLPALLLTAVLSLPALADTVQTDHDRNVNFEQFHTYSWGQIKTSNPFYVSRIRDRVDKDLQARGWQLVRSGGDTTVFATGNVRNEKQVETYYNGLGGWGGGWGWGGWGGGGWGGRGFGNTTSTTVHQPVGSLVIDIFSNSSKQLLWRGSMQRDLSSKSEKNIKALDKNIDKMFKDFPPKGEARGE